MAEFIFRGKHSSQFCLVNGVTGGLMPPISAKLVKAAGKKGAYNFGSEMDVRKYTIKATVTATTPQELESKLDEIKDWLYDGGTEGELIFDDKLQVSYQAQLDGDLEKEPLGTSAFITFDLLCADPIGEGVEKTYHIPSGSYLATVKNDGTAETQPTVKATFTEDAYILSVINGDNAVTIGRYPDATQPSEPSEEIVLTDRFVDPTIWTQGVHIDGGQIMGDFESNIYGFHQKGYDYGQYAGWHGAAKVRSLPTPIQDFKVEMECTFQASTLEEMGRVELYLLDENRLVLGKISINDVTWLANHQIAIARMGDETTGKKFVETYGSYKGVWSSWNHGILRLSRWKTKGGHRWAAYFATINPKTGRHENQLYREVTSFGENYSGKLAAIQVHTGACFDGKAYDYTTLNNLIVTKYNGISADSDNQPINTLPFRAGDEVEIDMESAVVYHNGYVANDLLQPSSDFLSIPSGTSQISVYPNIADVDITFKNKYL